MTRESKPTLTPNAALSSRENDSFSRFLCVADADPIFAFSCIRSYATTSELTSDARGLSADGALLPGGQVLAAIADLVENEVIFVLDPDEQTQAAMEQHTTGTEVSSIAKIKGYLGELVSHHVHLESVGLRAIQASNHIDDHPEDSDLYIHTNFNEQDNSGPSLDAA